ncbi:MAG: hypothetical protein V9G29_05220 [Burkholderiaceae bacterium]
MDAGDRLGGIITHGSSAPEALPPRSRDIGALALLQALVQNQPRAPGPMASGALGKALTTLRPLLRPGSSVVVLSDFSDFDDAGESALVALSMRAECRVVWLTDPLERQGLPAGAYRVGVPGRLWSLERCRESRRMVGRLGRTRAARGFSLPESSPAAASARHRRRSGAADARVHQRVEMTPSWLSQLAPDRSATTARLVASGARLVGPGSPAC